LSQPSSQFLTALQNLLQSLGYQLLGTSSTLTQQCNQGQGQCSLTYSVTLLEKPPSGSYFLIIPLQWGMSNAVPIDGGICYNYSTTRTITVYGIKQISQNNTIKDTLIYIDKTGIFTPATNCCVYDTTEFFGVGDSMYMPDNPLFPMLLFTKGYDQIELEVTIQQQNVYDTNCQNPYNAQCALEISNIQVYYVDIFSFLNNLSFLLTMVSLLTGLIK